MKKGRPTKEMDKPWRDKETLYELYWTEYLTSEEVADELECSKRTVLNWMEKHDIPKRKAGRFQEPAHYHIDSQGYGAWITRVDGEAIHVGVHRLVAVAHHGANISQDVIHHKNGFKADNRPENLEVTNPSDHGKAHGKERVLSRNDGGEIIGWK